MRAYRLHLAAPVKVFVPRAGSFQGVVGPPRDHCEPVGGVRVIREIVLPEDAGSAKTVPVAHHTVHRRHQQKLVLVESCPKCAQVDRSGFAPSRHREQAFDEALRTGIAPLLALQLCHSVVVTTGVPARVLALDVVPQGVLIVAKVRIHEPLIRAFNVGIKFKPSDVAAFLVEIHARQVGQRGH